jgi:hypothetical protein
MAAMAIKVMPIPQTIAIIVMQRSPDELAALAEKASSVYRLVSAGYIITLLFVALFSLLLIVYGNRVQAAIRLESAARIAQVKADAEQAARESNERIAALKLEADKARGEIESAKAVAAKANERAGALELETVQQREKAALAERALLELQQRVQDRHLTPQQRAVLGEHLMHGPKGEIHLLCVGGDPEPCAFAEELAQMLRDNGWTVIFGEPEHGFIFIGASPRGMFLRVHSGNIQRAVMLQQSLTAAGLEAPGVLMPDTPEDWIQLLIGYKP